MDGTHGEVLAKETRWQSANLSRSQDALLLTGADDDPDPLLYDCNAFGSMPSAASNSPDLSTERQSNGESDKGAVWLHVYDLDPYTGWANTWLDFGVYHCGVEIYGVEWSFYYFDGAWDEKKVKLVGDLPGVLHSTPKELEGYRYRESVYMGISPLTRAEVKDLIQKLRGEWLACTYHITQRNCVSFAETLLDNLRIGEKFPSWIKKLCDASKQSRVVNYVVDGVWGWHKWGSCIKSH
jgi:hypothetical protein